VMVRPKVYTDIYIAVKRKILWLEA